MFKKALTTTLRWGPQMAQRIPRQTMLVSGILGVSLYLTNQRTKSALAQTNAGSSAGSAADGKQNEDVHIKISWEVFSEESYKLAVKEGKNVILFVEPSRFKESFANEIEGFLENVNAFQKIVGGRPIVFMKLEFSESFTPRDLAKKFSVEIEEETLFLVKNKYLDLTAFSFSEYFNDKDAVVKYFREVPLLNAQNKKDFLNSLSFLSSETTLIVAYCPKENPMYGKLEERFGALTHLKQYSENKNLHFLLLNDEETAKELGLDKSNVGDMLLVTRQSKMGYGKSTHTINNILMNINQYANLKDKLAEIISKATAKYNEVNVFAGRSFDLDCRYSVVLEVDENRIGKQDRKKLVELMGKWKQHLRSNEKDLLNKVQFLFVKKAHETRSWSIYVRDDVKYATSIKLHSISTKEELDSLKLTPEDDLPHSYQFSFPSKTTTPDTQSLTEWLKNVQANTAKESFKSQTPPNYRKYSKKLVGKTFKEEVQENQRDQAVFFYSKHCHACKQYGHFYENLALEHLRKDPFQATNLIEFNRMNSDRNTLKTSKNFPYTPVFMIFKKNCKEHPFIYRSDKFTPKLLRDFLEVTAEFNLIDPVLIQNQVLRNKKVDIASILS